MAESTNLIESYYEDLNGEVLSLDQDEDSLTLIFECDDWSESSQSDVRRRFEIRGVQVIESTVSAPYRWVYDLYSTSGMLVEEHHGSEWIEVYWKSRPNNPHAVIGKLYENHERLANRMKDLREYLVASPELLSARSGLLLHGPSGYANSQAESVQDLLSVYTVATHREPQPVVGLGIDECFMICKSIELRELV